jgi:hypothetical protein
MTDRPTRRGFLAACSAAAAALGLTARAAPARPPIAAVPDGESFDAANHTHHLTPVSAGERLFAGDACYIGPDGRLHRSVVINGGSGYTSKPTVLFSGGGGSPATASVTPSGIVVKAR